MKTTPHSVPATLATLSLVIAACSVAPAGGEASAAPAALPQHGDATPVARATVSFTGGKRLVVNINPDLSGRKKYTFVLQKRRGSSWSKVGKYTTKGKREKKRIKVAPGTYRVKVRAGHGIKATTSARYRYNRGNPASSADTSTGGSASGGSTAVDSALAPFLTTSDLCDGVNCSALTLGDDLVSTSGASEGHLFSCTSGNPGAPGSDSSQLSWVNFARGTWDFLSKPWLPGGGSASGTYTESVSGSQRSISANGLPEDGLIGDWPMTQFPVLSAIDANPGTPGAQSLNYSLPADPQVAATPSCLPLGAVAVSRNGVVFYSAVDARGDDAVAHEIVDVHGGHPARDQYHYHFVPQHLEDATARLSDGHSGIIGFALDGFPLYGYYGVGGEQLSNSDLDECHGHEDGDLDYHYHATLEYPYTLGCFRGTPMN